MTRQRTAHFAPSIERPALRGLLSFSAPHREMPHKGGSNALATSAPRPSAARFIPNRCQHCGCTKQEHGVRKPYACPTRLKKTAWEPWSIEAYEATIRQADQEKVPEMTFPPTAHFSTSFEACSDCPPLGYPTDKTRCASCPVRHHQVARSLKRVPGGPLCHCGGPCTISVTLKYRRQGRWVDRTRMLCEIHGRACAIRWNLELPETL